MLANASSFGRLVGQFVFRFGDEIAAAHSERRSVDLDAITLTKAAVVVRPDGFAEIVFREHVVLVRVVDRRYDLTGINFLLHTRPVLDGWRVAR